MKADDGYYYMYQTDASYGNAHSGNGHFHARRSKDLVNWEYLGATMSETPPTWIKEKLNAYRQEMGLEPVSYTHLYLPTTAIADFEENFKIVMDADLDEYAHTTPLPFNRKPKKFVTESTSIVTGEELEKHPVTVLQNAFTSTVTGVETYEAQSEPGWSETAMYILSLIHI